MTSVVVQIFVIEPIWKTVSASTVTPPVAVAMRSPASTATVAPGTWCSATRRAKLSSSQRAAASSLAFTSSAVSSSAVLSCGDMSANVGRRLPRVFVRSDRHRGLYLSERTVSPLTVGGLDETVLILRGGRIVDPRSGTEQVADVAVDHGVVAAIGPSLPSEGATVVDVTGHVVGPGFVDLHSHVHSIAGQRLQALDGVTATLDLEAGLMPIETAYARAAADGRLLHYGFSASWGDARAAAHLGITPAADLNASLVMLGDPDWQRTSSPSERATWLRLLESELEAGALGIGVLMGYAPRTDPDEFLDV